MDVQRLLAISDSHGNVTALAAVLKWVQSYCPVDAAVFLGDGIEDLNRATMMTAFPCGLKMVRGNNDYEFNVPEVACLDFGGRRFFLCHGHRHNIYRDYHQLVAAAQKMEADTVLFGHTHVPTFETENGIVLINPGGISRPRSLAGSTFALVECAPEKPPKAAFWKIDDHGEITGSLESLEDLGEWNIFNV
jgi:putative phosphoesterase